MTRMLILSRPGDLLEGMDKMMCRTSMQVTGVKLKTSSFKLFKGITKKIEAFIMMLLTDARYVASAVFFPTEEKYWLKLSAISLWPLL